MTFREDLARQLRTNPEFRAVWERTYPRRQYIKRVVRAHIWGKAPKKRRR